MANITAKEKTSSLPKTSLEGAKLVPVLVTVLVGTVIWLIPAPEGVDIKAWHLLAIFAATIVGIIAKPLPMGAVAMLGIAVTAFTGTLTISESLSGFGNRVIWLIVIAFFISRGFIKTGLGARIAYLFMAAVGKKSLGVAYSMVATDLVLAPAIPSNTARAGGVIFPILRSIAKSYGSEPDDGTARKIGAFLIKTSFQGTVITSAMFLTAMAANPLAAKLAGDMGVEITWGGWALAAIVPGLVSLAIVPWVLYKVYPPEIKETPGATQIARDQLVEMGKLKPSEWMMLGTFFLLLFLWIFGSELGIHSTTAAFVGLGVLLLGGALTWNDILQEKGAWNTLVWFAALVMMATYLNELGLIPWFGEAMGAAVAGISWVTSFLILSLVYFYSHYFFASNTAHVSSMYGAFLAVAIAVGTPPMLAALVLAFFSNLFSSMTHYGTGPAPVLFGSGYVEMGIWWKLGALISVINIIIWLGIGGLWWKVIGLW
ncbi:anion permease [Acidobacteria bacterium AH-259-G07]|nr:anion permease [Acidobacteria bacterium AH-259-G07]